MTYSLQKQTTEIGKHATFNLAEGTTEYVVGLNYFKLSYGSKTDHHVKLMKVRLLPSRQGTTLTVNVSAIMEDSSGARLDDADSEVVIACISTTNAFDRMTNVLSIGGVTGDTRPVTFLAGPREDRTLIGSAAFLSGIDASYGKSDRHVRDIYAMSLFTPTGLRGCIALAEIGMSDSSGNNATTSGDVGVVALASADPSDGSTGSPLMVQLTTDIQFTEAAVSFPQPVADAVALITSFRADYGKDDRHVKTISVGAPGAIEVDGRIVRLKALTGAAIEDNSGHHQDNNLSSVTMTVLALPTA